MKPPATFGSGTLRLPRTSSHAALLQEASRPFLKAGPGLFAYFFARGKLKGDPVYRAILERGLLLDRARILDLGCGQGLLTAWLRGAERCFARGAYPSGWPPPPRSAHVVGIELMASEVIRSHRALGAACGVSQGDIRDAEFAPADAVVILDVLHYIAAAAQRDVLQRVRNALPVGGLLLLRVCDGGVGLRPRVTQWVDRVVLLMRGHLFPALHNRRLDEWQNLLGECGFDSESAPMSAGTPFANVLLIARAR